MTDSYCRGGCPRLLPWATCTALLWVVAPRPAEACGGLFCNNSTGQRVDQAAERILFTKEADGTVWATIEIRYEGRADRFAWLLPVEGEPEVHLGATRTLDVLQRSTDPTFFVNTNLDSSCLVGGDRGGGCACAQTEVYAAAPYDEGDGGGRDPDPVDVLRRERLGPYDYVLLSVADDASDPAAEAVRWLRDNGFDVYDDQAATLRPYLMSGQNLLAFRLAKDSDTGSIRPLRIEFGRGLPGIPIRPTAVAANDDMPILVFVLGRERAVPANYALVELNDALIDWLNPQRNYMAVVSAAVDEAGGQGFVTEYAGPSAVSTGQILDGESARRIERFREAARAGSDPASLLAQLISDFCGWEGFEEVLRLHTEWSPDRIETLSSCAASPGFSIEDAVPSSFDVGGFLETVEQQIFEPVEAGEAMVQRHAYLTRMITTMSPEEMTLDPMFDFTTELGDVPNQHTMVRQVVCFDDGGEIWQGTTEAGFTLLAEDRSQWPYDDPLEAGIPAALRIWRAGPEGARLVEDNRETIRAALDAERGEEGGCRLTRTQSNMLGSSLLLVWLGLWLAARRRRGT